LGEKATLLTDQMNAAEAASEFYGGAYYFSEAADAYLYNT
jgi:hypothetical protein